MHTEPRILVAGDSALVVEFGDAIDPAINREVRELLRAVEQAAIPGVIDLVPTYRSLLVCYDPLQLAGSAGSRTATAGSNGGNGTPSTVRLLQERLLDVNLRKKESELAAPRVIEVPTVYGGEFGPDLAFVASHNRLSEAEVVQIHAGTDYLVYMMGFSPGFPYLGGMSPLIATPRLKTPRTAIPAGSVGIAQEQTGVYPVESPGGWQLIGRTPARLFDAGRQPPVLVEAGDSIRFVPIVPRQFTEIEEGIRRGTWNVTAQRERGR